MSVDHGDLLSHTGGKNEKNDAPFSSVRFFGALDNRLGTFVGILRCSWTGHSA